MHPNLVFLWHKGRSFWAITGDRWLAAPINFIKGISVKVNFNNVIEIKQQVFFKKQKDILATGNWTALDSFLFPFGFSLVFM